MTPLEEARAIHERDGLDFGTVLEHYLRHGWVLSTPKVFVMAIATQRARIDAQWPSYVTVDDCWYVGCRVGDIASAWAFEPYPLPWYAFQKRGSRLHIWPRHRLRDLTSRHLVAKG